jgi:hypothetical protein
VLRRRAVVVGFAVLHGGAAPRLHLPDRRAGRAEPRRPSRFGNGLSFDETLETMVTEVYDPPESGRPNSLPMH